MRRQIGLKNQSYRHIRLCNKPCINETINLSNLIPHPKNHYIAKFLGKSIELKNLCQDFKNYNKFCKTFRVYNPIIPDENTFKFALPINFYDKIVIRDTTHNDKRERLITLFCKLPKTRYTKYRIILKLKIENISRRYILNPFVKSGELSLTEPDKHLSENQKYIAIKAASKYKTEEK